MVESVAETIVQYSLFFFFSSRRRHTRWNCDWSSDVCSSDLPAAAAPAAAVADTAAEPAPAPAVADTAAEPAPAPAAADKAAEPAPAAAAEPAPRSEERRVGKECRSRWRADDEKKKRRREKVT